MLSNGFTRGYCVRRSLFQVCSYFVYSISAPIFYQVFDQKIDCPYACNISLDLLACGEFSVKALLELNLTLDD